MYPDLLPAQIRILLEGMAIDLGDTGKDNLYGSGRLNFEQPGLHSVCYDLLNHEMTLEFGFPVMSNNICFDGIGMELEDSGKWDFQLSDGLGLKGKNKTPRILKLDLNRANATTINIAVAQLMNHKKVELLLKEGAFTYQFGYKVPQVQGFDNVRIKMLAGEFNLGKIGDVNGDDILTAYDAGLIMKASAKGIASLPISKATQEVDRWIEASTGRKCNIGKDMADWDRDGQVTSSDAASLLKWVVSNNASKSPGLIKMDDIPGKFALMQNFPNPFNPETWIPYQLSEPADVTIKIYNIKGQIVRNLKLGMKSAGFYADKSKAAYWDGKNESGEQVASGIYFYSIQAGNFTEIRKMIIRE
ncbi:T9SS type A sorting domain-containing protein, partial [Candidatus Poribacteria bacterium]|nr:T9SS type A sorting domain-containing protein [Candidatus Poribacteria bacterium]